MTRTSKVAKEPARRAQGAGPWLPPQVRSLRTPAEVRVAEPEAARTG